MKPLDNSMRFAETTAHLIMKAEESGLPDTYAGAAWRAAIRLLARAHVNLLDQVRALHDLVDQTDPNDPIGIALTKVGLERRPADPQAQAEPHLVRTPAQVKAMSGDDLLALYCRAGLVSEPIGTPLRCKHCGWHLITLKAWRKLPPFGQGYAKYMQGSWPASEIAREKNPYAEGTPECAAFREGEQRATQDAQDGEE